MSSYVTVVNYNDYYINIVLVYYTLQHNVSRAVRNLTGRVESGIAEEVTFEPLEI